MSEIRQIYLDPGGFHFGTAPLRLSTLLGSCVTITLWHPQRRLGGMCHIQFPRGTNKVSSTTLDGRYADDAFALFDQALERTATAANEYVAKLFGGGNMFPGQGTKVMNVGIKNLLAAWHELAKRGINPVVEHVGGAGHRKLICDLSSGDVWLSFFNIEQSGNTASG